jgi:hypothetical protein
MKSAVIAVLVGFLVAGCRERGVQEGGAVTTDSPKLAKTEQFKHLRSSLVYVIARRNGGCVHSGLGGFISNDGTVLTAAHLADNADTFEIYYCDSRLSPTSSSARLKRRSPTGDLAILSCETTSVQHGAFALNSSGFGPWEDCYVATFSAMGNERPSFVPMLVKTWGVVQFEDGLYLQGALPGGCSGSPVLNSGGELVGVVSATVVLRPDADGAETSLPMQKRSDGLPNVAYIEVAQFRPGPWLTQ